MSDKVLFSKENKELAKTIVLNDGWLLYIDENMNIWVKYSMFMDFHADPDLDYHNHWWDDEDLVDVLARDVEFTDKDKASLPFLDLIEK